MQAAYVLHRWPYLETSLLCELLTVEHGRIRVIAKGARRPKSPWRSVLQPFQPLLVEFRGRHDLQTLISAEIQSEHNILQLRGLALYSGFYATELLQRLTTLHQPLEGIFADYQWCIAQLASDKPVEPVLRRYEWALLEDAGLAFDWHHDYQTQLAIAADQQLQFIPEQGFTVVTSRESLETDSALFSGAEIAAMSAFELDTPHVRKEFKRLMRLALAPYLGPKPLKSRELLGQMSLPKE